MAQTVNILRSSFTAPLAIGIMVVGLFLLCTKRISEGCFLLLMVLGGAVWLVPKILDGLNEFSIAQLNNDTSHQNLLAEKEKTKQLKFHVIIKFLGFAAPIIGLIVFLLKKLLLAH
jgi:DMSO reductase anchor subunit